MKPDLIEIAKVYNESPITPTKRVRERFGAPTATVGRWIRRCRDNGLIAADPREWRLNDTFEAVAAEIGVDAALLADAILEHSGSGHLWVPVSFRNRIEVQTEIENEVEMGA